MNNNRIIIFVAVLLLSLFSFRAMAQDNQGALPGARLWGNFQMDSQYYVPDIAIGADTVRHKLGMNAFSNINFSYRNFTAGIRFESYNKRLEGYPNYDGTAIPFRFVSYSQDNLDITLGNYYEQFGNGLIFRSYVDHGLGLDNAMDGVRVVFRPSSGVTLKGLVGNQRNLMGKGPGIVRGVDAEVNLNDLISPFLDNKNKLILGGSLVSKFQDGQFDPLYNLPENVAALAGRLNFTRGAFNLNSEFAYKVNDPSSDNNFIYKPGHALMVSASYSLPGVGLLVSAKRVDNMSFRSDRNATENALTVNYLPPATKQHVYSLTAMYPYATQLNGEVGLMAEGTFRLPRQSFLGGPFGATITANYSIAKSIEKIPVGDNSSPHQAGTLGYTSSFFKVGDILHFQDLNIEYSRRFSRTLRGLVSYAYITYNPLVVEGYDNPMVHAHVVVADFTHRLPNRKSLRWELQYLATKQDKGNWAMAAIEYSIAPSWSFSVIDQYNYGNPTKEERNHYYTAAVSYSKNANRISVSYGRQREGIICVGGVCRRVPASNGLMVSVTSSF
ncbi:MAG: hypothetical protein EOM23_00545 [Candidatus Moranbacteria bacterium]|nr:hypothetical protein [Candidatus Moranbacteria bacterium]